MIKGSRKPMPDKLLRFTIDAATKGDPTMVSYRGYTLKFKKIHDPEGRWRKTSYWTIHRGFAVARLDTALTLKGAKVRVNQLKMKEGN